MEVQFVENDVLISLPWPPPPEKDEIKQLGAKWDAVNKLWRAPLSSVMIRWLDDHDVVLPDGIIAARDENLAASRASDADISVPVPDGINFRPFQLAGVAWGLRHQGALIGDDMGLGKQQPVSEPVLTPTGWRAIGSLSVGDMVMGADGYPTRVSGVYPQSDHRVVRVTMSDGSWTRCGWDHLWLVERVQSRNPVWRTMTTAELIAGGLVDSSGNRTWRIPMVQSIEFPPTKCPIDPYVLGVVLGDGSISSKGYVRLTTDVEIIEMIGVPGKIVHHPSEGIAYLNTMTLAGDIKDLGLAGCRSHEKFVPSEYLHGSVDDRYALLQGLLDTDGYAHPDGGVEFCSTSPMLVDAVVEIVESLGGVARGRRNAASTYVYNGVKRVGKKAERVNIKLPPHLIPFRLLHKAAACVIPTKYPPTRIIASITPEPDEESVCIRVEASDHLYVTRHHIVTHNTIQALGVINADTDMRSALVVCPLSVALNWKSEAEKWLVRKMTIGVATGKEWPETDMVIAHWGIIGKHAETIRSREWDLVVLDEAHYAKNPRAGRTKAIIGDRKTNLKPLEAKRRMALSGTPIPNRPIEIYPLLNWLAPQEFANWMTFATRYCNGHKTQFGWDVSGASHLDELQERLRSVVMIRRLKKDVLPELPPKTRQVILFSPDSADARKALSSEKKTSAEIGKTLAKARAALELAKAESEEDYQRAVKDLHSAQGVAFTEMSQARHATAVAKIPQVLEHVKDVLANDGQKVVLFAHHRDVINSLRSGLETTSGEWTGVATVSIVGGDSAEHRQEVVHSFQTDPRVRVFLGSIGAAKEGITLTAANVAIFAEIDWVPGNMSQAEDRIFRIGQVDSVSIQHVLLDGSLDATMIKTIVRKQEVIEQALDIQVKKEDRVRSTKTDESGEVGVEAEQDSQPATQPATQSTTREEIAKRAERITESEIDLVHQGLRLLAFHDSDGASVVNDVGFSKIDVAIGHRLADIAELSPKQASLGAKLVAKYHRQIPQEIAGVWKALGVRGSEEVQALEARVEDDQSQVQTLSLRRR